MLTLPRRREVLCLSLLALPLVACDSDAGVDRDAPASLRGASLADANVMEGHFESRIATMLDGSARVTHHLHTAEQIVEIVWDDATPAPAYRSWVRVSGSLATDGRWEVDAVLEVSEPQHVIDAEPRAPRRIGTVVVFWDQDGGLANGLANDSMFTGEESTNVYYGEISYGIETLAGKVFGPYQIPDPGGCNVNFISDQADLAMMNKGWDPDDYTQMAYYFPGGTGCGFAGLASVGSPDFPARNSWYHGSFGCTTRNQELGHNYGMGHSYAYSCPANPDGMDHNLFEDCSHVEYGHPYDPMGNGCGHMNVVQKQYMGWIDGCNVVNATTDGTFNLLPLEWPCEGTQALIFPAYDGRFYQLEYRNGDTDFGGGSGVLVNIAPQVAGFGPSGYVLDELGQNENGFLVAGDTFSDPGGTLSFTVAEMNETHAVIQLTFTDGGDGDAPTCKGGGAPEAEAGAVGSLLCVEAPYPGDDTPPEVTITYPEDGQLIAPGSDFDITADATDDRQIIEVELYLDGESFDVLTEPPWEWHASAIPEGEYEFGVIARDARAWTASQAVTINVGDAAPTEDTGSVDDSGGATADDSTVPGTTTDPEQSEGTGDETGDPSQGSDDSSGCACSHRNQGGGTGFALLLFGLGWLGRRERLRDLA